MASLGEAANTVRQGWRFATGLRRFLRDPVSFEEARRDVERAMAGRVGRLLGSMDRLVWQVPTSPYQPLLEHAGVDRADLRSLVERRGVEGALLELRDRGVYISYEEYLGKEPVRRGSLEMHVTPSSFHNPTIRPDYLGSTGGSRSGGTPIATTFEDKRTSSVLSQITRVAHGIDPDIGSATWLPCLPSAAGLAPGFRPLRRQAAAETGALPQR